MRSFEAKKPDRALWSQFSWLPRVFGWRHRAAGLPVPARVLEVLVAGRIVKKTGDFDAEEKRVVLKSEIPQESKDLDHLLEGWVPEFNKGK